MTDTLTRTAVKTLTWRIWMMITNSTVGWVVTGDPWKGLSIGAATLVINSISYIIHERLWNRSDWGQQ
jgi:uncharacterized membrane protein